jgi:hypothetical protein
MYGSHLYSCACACALRVFVCSLFGCPAGSRLSCWSLFASCCRSRFWPTSCRFHKLQHLCVCVCVCVLCVVHHRRVCCGRCVLSLFAYLPLYGCSVRHEFSRFHIFMSSLSTLLFLHYRVVNKTLNSFWLQREK